MDFSWMKSKRRIAIVSLSFDVGGVERMLTNLAGGFASHGIDVDLLVKNIDKPFLDIKIPKIQVHQINGSSEKENVNAICDYFRQQIPSCVLSSKPKDDSLMLTAKRKSGLPIRTVIRSPVNISSQLRLKRRNPIKKWLVYRDTRNRYQQADAIIAVSKGVAQDIAHITGLGQEKVHVLPNPVITPQMLALSGRSAAHPWLENKRFPVIVGSGRLSRQKNFQLLIRAFARVRERCNCRLIILGSGRYRARLDKLSQDLGVSEHVDLAGFKQNPYAILANADLFVLSSNWEGSPNALTEAMAMGVPVVATDCDSGPRELLKNGELGPLVPVGDQSALSEAIYQTLQNPIQGSRLQQAAQPYHLENSTREYLKVLGIDN